MLLVLFILIQSQEPPRLSKLVIAGAVLFFIVGISLLIYFLRRLKASEKEAEEDWSMSRSSLFVERPASPEPTGVDAASTQPSQTEEATTSTQRSETRILASDPALEELHEIVQSEPVVEPEVEPPVVHHLAPEPPRTEMLASPRLETPAPVEVTRETTPFSEEIWAELEMREPESSAPVQPVVSDQTTQLHSPSIERTSEPQTGNLEPERSARVEHRAPREPFEPPTIKPITPREQSEMVRSQQRATRDLYASSKRDENAASEPASDASLYSQPANREVRAERQSSTPYEPRGTRELAAEPVIQDISPTPVSEPVETSFTPAHVMQSRERRAPAGAILGLPTEGAQGPMILGQPAKPRDEIGIGGLTRYGKPLEKDGERGGTIALLLVILIVGGGLAAYLFVPSVHSQVNAWVDRMRGVDPNRKTLSTDPKVMIIASRVPEINKNMVKAKGSVDNVSNETLEDLALEIKLVRANNESPEIRTIPITPAQLAPNGHGVYEFEYDGSRETGFIQYTITRMLSGGNELKYTSPGQK